MALERRPQPVDIPANSSASADPSPEALLQHAAAVGSPTTTAPIMDSIRRTRSTGEEGAQVHALNPAPQAMQPSQRGRANAKPEP